MAAFRASAIASDFNCPDTKRCREAADAFRGLLLAVIALRIDLSAL
jgi:hypothetical protein